MPSLPVRPFVPRAASLRLGALLSSTTRESVHFEIVRVGGPPPLPRPPMVDWTHGVTDWGTLGNDVAGNCTVAAMGHLIASWTDSVGVRDTISADDALAMYSLLTGYSQSTGSFDEGLAVDTMIQHWVRAGSLFGHSIHEGLRAARVQAFYVNWIKAAIAQYGGAVLTLRLSTSAMSAFMQGQPWAGDMGPLTDYHCVAAVSYDDECCEVVTWGRLQRVHWSFVDAHLEELWCLLGDDWVSEHSTPIGVSSQETRARFRDWGSVLAT